MSKVITNNITPRSGSSVGLTGDLTASGNITGTTGTFSGSVSVGGTITYEDVTNIDSVGIVTARTGVRVNAGGLVVTAGVSTLAADLSIADKIIHTGDTNTAIRFPADDTFTVETAGSERVRVGAGGSVGINETTPDSKVDILHSTATNGATENLIHLRTDPGAGYVDRGLFVKIGKDGVYDNSAVHYDIVGSSGNSGFHAFEVQGDEKLRITTAGAAIFKAGLAEKFQTGTTIQADPTLALSDGNVVLRTSNESGNQAVNFTGVHSTLAVGEAVSFTVIITPNGSGAINNVQIDSAAQTTQWSGGSAPSAGASGKDVYTFTLLKTGSGTTNYQVFGAATNYA